MRAHRISLRVLAATLGLGLFGAGAGITIRVWAVTHPLRSAPPRLEFESVRLTVEEVEFPAADGVSISGWLFPGGQGPPIVLAHDVDGSRADLLALALALQARGFTPLAVDLRAHGQSAGTRSTLGIAERRDIVGAIDFLEARGIAPDAVGVYGLGLGAHAAVLAAATEPRITVLVLDGLYPDAGWLLSRRAWSGVGWVPAALDRLASAAFTALGGGRVTKDQAAQLLPRLSPRDVLLIAPESDPQLVATARTLLDAIPEDPDHDGNLIITADSRAGDPGTNASREYLDRIASFFGSRLVGSTKALRTRASVRP